MLKILRRTLREEQTETEELLWHYLRNRKFHGHKFRRQHVLRGYIVDFVCLEQKLVIELDGSQHNQQADYDNYRTKEIAYDEFRVIRFWNNDVLKNITMVLNTIYDALNETILNTPHPASGHPLPQGERGTTY